MSLSKSPAFNLKVILQETNLAADTLRAWERRYGLPVPQRSAGGHRLYSQYDLETIKWLLTRQMEGLSISRAVDLWNEQTASGIDPLAGITPSTHITPQATPAIYTPPGTSLDSLRDQWITACLNFSESVVEQTLTQAFSIFPIESVCMDVLQKGLSKVGDLWYEDKASVQQEHFASALAMRRLDALISASPAPTRNQTIVVGCPPNEWHTFTPLLLTLLLRRRGLNVIYLGANVPDEQFEETIKSVNAKLVILVAQTLSTAASLQSTADSLTERRVPIGYGGRVFTLQPNLIDHISGHYLGGALIESLDKVEVILQNKFKPSSRKTSPNNYVAAHQAFTSKRIHIEGTLKEMKPFADQPEVFDIGIRFLGDNIAAALQLGNMENVTAEMDWAKTLMQSRKGSFKEITYFMEAYLQAVDKHINGSGAVIKNWLKIQAQSVKGIL